MPIFLSSLDAGSKLVTLLRLRCITIGNFDGVHVGHQALLSRARVLAGGGGAVAGDHNELETEAAEFGESGGGGGLDDVFEGEGADELAVGDDADDGGTGDGGGAVGVGGAADDDLAAADLGPDAEAGSGGEIGDGRKSEAAFAGGGDDGAGERVFAGGFGGGGAGGGGGAAGGIARGAGAV